MGTIAALSTTVASEATVESFVIEGGRPLNGTVRAAGNKNGALPIIAACVLTDEPVVLRNIPRIRDVDTMLALLADLGADVEWLGENEVRIQAAGVSKTEVDEELSDRIRGSFLLAGPLLARYGHVLLSPPGGDFIGRRPLDTHVHAFQQLGAEVAVGRRFELRADKLVGKHIFLDEASVMGTENAVMAATLAQGRDHADERSLRAARAGSLPLPRLARRADRGDRLEHAAHRGCHRALGRRAPHRRRAHRGGELHRARGRHRRRRDRRGHRAATTSSRSSPRSSGSASRSSSARRACAIPPGQELVIRDDLGDQIPKIEDGPWPMFPADLTSIALAVATQATRDDPDLREDVREPPVLRRQARPDGRADHPLRPAPRSRHRPGEAARRSGSRAPTSAPAWR